MACNEALISKVQEILSTNDEILTIGGDHAIGFGMPAIEKQNKFRFTFILP